MNEKCLGDDYLGQLLALQHCKSLGKTEQLLVLEYSSNIRSITGRTWRSPSRSANWKGLII